MRSGLFVLGILLVMAGLSFSNTIFPQDLFFDDNSHFYDDLFNSDPEACPSCLSIGSYGATGMTAFNDAERHVIELNLFYADNNADPPRHAVANTTILVFVPLKKELYLIYTDPMGIATYNLSPYDNDPNGVCQKIQFIYCPFAVGCGFKQCLDMVNITPQSVTTYPQSLMAIPQPSWGTNYVPAVVRLPTTYQLLPSVAAVPYCPVPPKSAKPGSVEFCLPFLLIFGLLVAALQLSGRNPFGSFDLSAPRITHHVRYEPRMRGKSINWSTIMMGFARSAMEFSGGGEGEEEGKGEGGGAGEGGAKSASSTGAAAAGGKTKPGAASGGKVGQVQMAGGGKAAPKIPDAKKAGTAWYDKSLMGGQGASRFSVAGLAAGFIPFVGLTRQIGSAGGNAPKKSGGAGFMNQLGNMLALAFRASNLYIFAMPGMALLGATLSSTSYDAKGGRVGTTDQSEMSAIKKMFTALGCIPLIGVFFKALVEPNVANAKTMTTMKAAQAEAEKAKSNVQPVTPGGTIDGLARAINIKASIDGRSVDVKLLEGGDAKSMTGFAFMNGQVVRVDNGVVRCSQEPAVINGQIAMKNGAPLTFAQLDVGGQKVFILSNKTPIFVDGRQVNPTMYQDGKFTGTVMAANGNMAIIKDNKIEGMQVGGRWFDIRTDQSGRQVMVPQPITSDMPDFARQVSSKVPARYLEDAINLPPGQSYYVPTYDGTTLKISTTSNSKGETVLSAETVTGRLMEHGSKDYNQLPKDLRASIDKSPAGPGAPSGYIYEGKEYRIQRDGAGAITSVMIVDTGKVAAGSPDFNRIIGGMDTHAKFDLVNPPRFDPNNPERGNFVLANDGTRYGVERDAKGQVTGLIPPPVDIQRQVVGTEANPLSLTKALGIEPGVGAGGLPQRELRVGDVSAAYAGANGTSFDLYDKDHKGTTLTYRMDGRVGVANDATTANRMDVSLGTTHVDEQGRPTNLIVISDTDLMGRLMTPGAADQKILPTAFIVQPDGSVINAHTNEKLDGGQRAALLMANPPQHVNDINITLHDPSDIKKYGTDQIIFRVSGNETVPIDARTGQEMMGARGNAASGLLGTLPGDVKLGSSGALDQGNNQRKDLYEAQNAAADAFRSYSQIVSGPMLDEFYKLHPALSGFQDDLDKIAAEKGTRGRAEEQRKIEEAAAKAAAKDPELDKDKLVKNSMEYFHPSVDRPWPLPEAFFERYDVARKGDDESRHFVGSNLIGGTSAESNPYGIGAAIMNNYLALQDSAGAYYQRGAVSIGDPTFMGPNHNVDVGKVLQGTGNDALIYAYAHNTAPSSAFMPQMSADINNELHMAGQVLNAHDAREAQEADEKRRISAHDLAIGFHSYLDQNAVNAKQFEDNLVKSGEQAMKAAEDISNVSALGDQLRRERGLPPLGSEKQPYERMFDQADRDRVQADYEKQEEGADRLLKKRETAQEREERESVEAFRPYKAEKPSEGHPPTPPETPPSEPPPRPRRKRNESEDK